MFFDAVVKSFTESGLSPLFKYEPPHNTFDISKLGDGALIGIKVNVTFDFLGRELSKDGTVLLAVVRDKAGKAQVFAPDDEAQVIEEEKNVRIAFPSFSKDGILTVPPLEKIKVAPFPIGNSNLDWKDPDKTFTPGQITLPLVGDLARATNIQITYKQIDLLEGGDTSKAPAKKAREAAPAFVLQGAQNPSSA